MRDYGFPSAHVHNKKYIIERTYRIMLRQQKMNYNMSLDLYRDNTLWQSLQLNK